MSDEITSDLGRLADRIRQAATATGAGTNPLTDRTDPLDARLREINREAGAELARSMDLDGNLRRLKLRAAMRQPTPQRKRTESRVAVSAVLNGDTPRTASDGPAAEAFRDTAVVPISLDRVAETLDGLDVRYFTDGSGTLLALWERHAVLFAIEGPDDEILVIRARPHATVPPDWADRAYRVVNEWNHTRRFCKAYVGDQTDRNRLPIYAEMQVPLRAGVHDALLVEMVDCAAAVALGFVDWLHDEGALL